MQRISIDVTPEQHQRLKAMAALQGKSIKAFVLDSTIGTQSDDVDELEALLDRRLKRARTESGSTRTVEAIFEHARRTAEPGPDA